MLTGAPFKRGDAKRFYRNIGLFRADGAAWCHRHPAEVWPASVRMFLRHGVSSTLVTDKFAGIW